MSNRLIGLKVTIHVRSILSRWQPCRIVPFYSARVERYQLSNRNYQYYSRCTNCSKYQCYECQFCVSIMYVCQCSVIYALIQYYNPENKYGVSFKNNGLYNWKIKQKFQKQTYLIAVFPMPTSGTRPERKMGNAPTGGFSNYFIFKQETTCSFQRVME